MKKSNVLVVVDMQPRFDASNDERVLQRNERAILEALEADVPIVVLEYKWYGKTHKRLMDLIKKGRYVVKKKDSDDGSFEVNQAICRLKIEPKVLFITGVNANACVESTFQGLAETGFVVKVLSGACNCTNFGNNSGFYFSGFNKKSQWIEFWKNDSNIAFGRKVVA